MTGMAAALAPPRATGGPISARRKLLMLLCAVAIVALAAETAIEGALGGNKLLLVLPIAVFGGIGLMALGLVDFQRFVLTTIVLRASLDVVKGGPTSNGVVTQTTASASGLDPAGALAVLLIVLAYFWFLGRLHEGRKSPPASIHRICLILFAIAGFLSVIDSSNILVSLLAALRIASVVVMLAVLEVMLVDRAAIQRMVTAIYLSAIVPVGYALFNIATHHSQFSSGGFGRYEGTFAQPNPFAIYLTLLIVMGVAIFPHLSRRQKWLLTPLLIGSVICLYYTFTRSAWLAALVGVVAVAIFGRRRLTLGLIVVAAMVSVVAVPTIMQRFADLGQARSASGYANNSLVWRFDYWDQILPLADKDPITGIGLGMSSFETVQQKEPHNDFLRAYVETGVVGTIAYFALLFSMVAVAWQSMRHTKWKKRSYERSVAVGFASCVIAFMMISIVSNVITEVVVLWYYVAFAAAAYAVTRYRENAVLRGLPVPAEEGEEA